MWVLGKMVFWGSRGGGERSAPVVVIKKARLHRCCRARECYKMFSQFSIIYQSIHSIINKSCLCDLQFFHLDGLMAHARGRAPHAGSATVAEAGL